MLTDVSPSNTTFATHSIDALVARAGPLPLPPLPLRSHQAATSNHLVDVDYCRIQVKCITLSDETPLILSRCHSLSKSLGIDKDAQLCLRYELPPLTSSPEIAAGGAEATVDDDKSQVMITVGDVLSIYPPSATAFSAKDAVSKDGRVTTNRRRIKSKARIAKSTAIGTTKAIVGGGCRGEEIQLQHSNLLAIAFVSDKDVASWGGSLTIDLVCPTTGNADPLRLASCRFPLDDVLSSRSLDVRMQLDLIAEEVEVEAQPSSLPTTIGSLVARITLIGGNSREDEDHRRAPIPTNTKLPIIDLPPQPDRAASPANPHDERKDQFAEDLSTPSKSIQAKTDEKQPHPIESVPATRNTSPLHLPPILVSAPNPSPAPDHRRFEYRPTLHPSDTRATLERQLCRNDAAAHRIQTCVRGLLFRRRWERSVKEKEQCIAEEADLDVDSPPPPPPPTASPPPLPLPSPSASLLSKLQQATDLPGQGGDEAHSGPCRPCDLSSLGEFSSPASLPEDIIEGSGTSSSEEGQMQIGIRLGSCKGLAELVSTCHDPGLCMFESNPVVAVSCTIFSGFDGLEATIHSKALPFHLSTSSFDFDSEQMVTVSLNDDRIVEYLKNESLEMRLWLLPASHSSMLQNFPSGSLEITSENLLATAYASLAPLLDCYRCASGYRQFIPWKPKGWLDGEHIGSLDVAIYRAGVELDQLQPYSEDLFSISSGISNIRQEDKVTSEENLPSASRLSPAPFSTTKGDTSKQGDNGSSSANSSGASSSTSRFDGDSSSDGPTSSESGDTDRSRFCIGSCSADDEASSVGDVQSLSGVMESLESVKKSLSHHFDGESGNTSRNANAVENQVDDGKGMVDTSESCKEACDDSGARSATSSDGEDKAPTTASKSFVDVGTSPIDIVDNTTACEQAENATSLVIASEEAASQTDSIGGTPSRSMSERCHKSTNTLPVHSPSSSSTESSDGDDVDLSRSQSSIHGTTNPQIPRNNTSSSSTSTFRRRRRFFSSGDAAADNLVESTARSPTSTTTTSRALSRARIPLEYRRSRFNELPASPATSSPATRNGHLSSADRISTIMAQYSRPSGAILLGRSLYESSSSSSSCSSSVGEEDSDDGDE